MNSLLQRIESQYLQHIDTVIPRIVCKFNKYPVYSNSPCFYEKHSTRFGAGRTLRQCTVR